MTSSADAGRSVGSGCSMRATRVIRASGTSARASGGGSVARQACTAICIGLPVNAGRPVRHS
jgi:hypothetical protein